MKRRGVALRTFVTSGARGTRLASAAASPGAGFGLDVVVSVLEDSVPAAIISWALTCFLASIAGVDTRSWDAAWYGRGAPDYL